MSLEKAKADLEQKGFLDHVIELKESTATVAEAAEALDVKPGMIAKTMSFLQGEKAVLILTEGTAKVDNHKYKDTFHIQLRKAYQSSYCRYMISQWYIIPFQY